MARALAVLMWAGGTLVLVTLLLPHSRDADDVGLAVAIGLAYLAVPLLLAGAETIPVGGLWATLAFGGALISFCVLYGGRNAYAYAFMYVWLAVYACYFFSSRAAAAQLVLCLALFSAVALGRSDVVPAAQWLMASGTIVVGGMLIGRLTAGMRAQATDLQAISEMAGGLTDVSESARATCEGLKGSTRADAVLMLEPRPDGDGLAVTAAAGRDAAGLIFRSAAGQDATWRCYLTSERQTILVDEPRRLSGRIVGLAQPVLRDGRVAAVLAVGWTTPRRSTPARASQAAILFAAHASVAFDRAERLSQDRERRALEINDNIVQGLVVAKYLAQRGDVDAAIEAIDETLGRARRLITDQLHAVASAPGGLQAGDLARAEPSSVSVGGRRD